MKITKAVVAAGLAVVLGTGSAVAAEGQNTTRVGIGPQLMFIDQDSMAPGFSVRYWATNEFGLEGNIFYKNSSNKVGNVETDSDTLLGSLKLMYAPIVNDNSRFYVGLEGGIGSQDNGSSDNTDFYLVKPLIGTEFNFSDFNEVGFNIEVGYAFSGADDNSVENDVNGIKAGFGAHYYF